MNRREAFQKMALGLGYAITLPSAGMLLKSCNEPKKDFGELLFFNPKEASLVEAMAECILPDSPSSPGATKVGVIDSIDLLINNIIPIVKQKDLRKQMDSFQENCNGEYGSNFEDLDLKNQSSAMTQLVQDEELSELFFSIKNMTTLSYFAKMEIGMNVMNYNPLPGNYEACVEITKDEKGWYM